MLQTSKREGRSPSGRPGRNKQTVIKNGDPAANGSAKEPMSPGSWRCVALEALPPFLRDNEFLLHGHRPQLHSSSECARSVFRLHTETCNIWTHLLGCLGAAALAVYYLGWEATDWPQRLTFSLFFAGAIFCLGASTCFHLMECHSEPMAKFMSKLDYCGVIALIVSSSPPWVYYGLYCHSAFLKAGYLGLYLALGLLCVIVVMQDKFGRPQYRPLRAGLFVGLGLMGVVPTGHMLLLGDESGALHWLPIMAALYIGGALVYAVRVPERLSPGTFDIWCHSHQILHVCVNGGVLACYKGATIMADWRLALGDTACS